MGAAADPGFARGQTMARAERESKQASGGGAPGGVQGHSTWSGVTGAKPLKVPSCPLKSFLSFSYKKWPKVKDLNENLPPCLRKTAWRSHDQH